MSRIYVPTEGVDDWRRLLADPDKHWRLGYSAMAVAMSWENAKRQSSGLPHEIAAILGENAELILAIPEHKVPLPGGERPSQSDVFALVRVENRTMAVMVEAKVSEPFGLTIGSWMKSSSDGRIIRLQKICTMLEVHYPPPLELQYQLFHRTASAVFEARRFGTDAAAMIVQSFSQERCRFKDFVAFCRLLGINDIQHGEADVVTLSDGLELTLGWVTGDERFITK